MNSPSPQQQSQEDLINFVNDPENLRKAAEGSMDKRNARLNPSQQQSEDELELIEAMIQNALIRANPLCNAVFEAHKLMQLIKANRESYAQEQVRQALTALKNKQPDPDDDSQFSPDRAGGWHTPTYQLAVADFLEDIEAELASLDTNKQETKQ